MDKEEIVVCFVGYGLERGMLMCENGGVFLFCVEKGEDGLIVDGDNGLE